MGRNYAKIRGVARNRQPSASSDLGEIDMLLDDVGRPVMTPYHMRDMISTATATLSTGTNTALQSGNATEFFDLLEVTFANTSTGAVTVDLIDDGTTAKTFRLPADSTSGATFTVPIPQGAKGGNWTADMDDVSNTTVNVSATFIKNV